MAKTKRIFIVGHMGARKSLIGQSLAEKLGWQYVNANPGLERYFGRNLSEIFGKHGEEAFHQFEAEVISHYLSKENVVLVMEESVIATEKNRKLLSSEFVIYSKVSTAQQVERMSEGQPPVFPIVDPKDFLDKQHRERDSLFDEVAKLTIEHVSIDEDLKKIIKAIEK